MHLVYFIGLLTVTNIAFHLIFSIQSKMTEPISLESVWFHVRLMPVYAVLNILTGIGYLYGKQFFGTLTLSIASSNFIKFATLLLVTFIVLQEIPTLKTYIGLSLILIGIVIAK